MSPRSANPAAQRRASAGIGAAVLLVLPQLAIYVAAGREAGPVLTPRLLSWRANPNDASAAELALLPGIGPVLAGRIVEYRAHASMQPAFASLEDLDRVMGIGPAKLDLLRECIALPSDGGPPAQELP